MQTHMCIYKCTTNVHTCDVEELQQGKVAKGPKKVMARAIDKLF